MKWLIVYDNGIQEIVDADDFNKLAEKINDIYVVALIRLASNVYAESYSPYR